MRCVWKSNLALLSLKKGVPNRTSWAKPSTTKKVVLYTMGEFGIPCVAAIYSSLSGETYLPFTIVLGEANAIGNDNLPTVFSVLLSAPAILTNLPIGSIFAFSDIAFFLLIRLVPAPESPSAGESGADAVQGVNCASPLSRI